MKLIFSLVLALLLTTGPSWGTDFEKARTEAAQNHKMILLSFSGSDWCIPCIRLHDQVFESEAFKKYADSNLVLVNADFPRLKKNKLSAALAKQNEALAGRYNVHGSFPLTLLLDADGKIIKQWEGYPGGTAVDFIGQINTVVHAGK